MTNDDLTATMGARKDATPHPYDHVRGDGNVVDAGVYRVVGVSKARDSVTLLRVANSRGRRVHQGRLAYVDSEQYRVLEAAANPDEPSMSASVAVLFLGAALVFVGSAPETLASVGISGVPELLSTGLVFLGALVLVVGVRRVTIARRLR